ncbi:MAG: acyltransferase domain-containing protein [Thermaerobacter sp.]|nr:acyltransferase domain-containing protein [Thermaerobacter sp.]
MTGLKPRRPKQGVVIFPGQGDWRLDDKSAHHPAIRRALAEASELCGQWIPPVSAVTAASSQVERQLALIATSVGGFEGLTDLGFEPVAAGGISLGEFAAAVVSGALSRDQGYRAVLARARCMEQFAYHGTMMAVLGWEMETLTRWLRDRFGDCVYVSATYGERTHLLSGTRDDLDSVRVLLRRGGVHTAPVPAGIPSHCRLMARALPCLTAAFRDLVWNRPTIPWISGMDGFITRDPHEIQSRLAQQTVEPVSWPKVRRTLWYIHNNVIDGGPGHSISRLVKAGPELFLVANSDDIKAWDDNPDPWTERVR